jgi:branched-chain amino acid transport system permease protein
MLDPQILLAGVLNGLLAGGIYVLVAVGLTLIYGVLHIINFAHGSLLMLAMYAVFFLWKLSGLDPYVALPLVTAGAFAVGFVLYRLLIGRYSHGKDENILLITLGVSIIADNGALLFFGGDTETIDVPYAGRIIEGRAPSCRCPRCLSCGRPGDLPRPRPVHGVERHRQGDPRRRQGAPGRAARSASTSSTSLRCPTASASPASAPPPAC